MILMFTDASAHPLGAVIDSGAYPRSIARSQDELFEQWGYQSSQSAVMENSAKRLILFAPDLNRGRRSRLAGITPYSIHPDRGMASTNGRWAK